MITMLTRVQRWGNSLALRIPKPIAVQVGIALGGVVDLEVKGSALVIRPVTPSAYELDELLAGVTDGNLHDEAATDGPVGSEAW
jgi:antitoxin MazE